MNLLVAVVMMIECIIFYFICQMLYVIKMYLSKVAAYIAVKFNAQCFIYKIKRLTKMISHALPNPSFRSANWPTTKVQHSL